MGRGRGISRGRFLAGSAALAALGLFAGCGRGDSSSEAEKTGASGGLASGTGASPGGSEMRLILLGTSGGPMVNEQRSSPAQVILANEVPYVVDCGSGVARQMVSAGVDLKDLRGVFVTHQHSDHNLDYGNLLYQAWISGLSTTVDAYGPPPLAEITDLFIEQNGYDIGLRVEEEERKPFVPLVRANEMSEGALVVEDENVKVTSTLVEHPPVEPSFAYRFDTDGRSIVVSGDTNYSEALIELARGADVLVHEAIYEPGVRQALSGRPNEETLYEVILDAHTTAEDAGRAANEAGVKTLVLSHLIPGDPSVVPDDTWRQEAEKRFDGEVIVGSDLMEI